MEIVYNNDDDEDDEQWKSMLQIKTESGKKNQREKTQKEAEEESTMFKRNQL